METLESSMKQAWGSDIPASASEASSAAGTLAGMQRPVKSPMQRPVKSSTTLNPGPLAMPAKNPFPKPQRMRVQGRLPLKSPSTSSHPNSSLSSITSSSLEDTTTSESDDDKFKIANPQTPMGMAPPPPLRNIPHQTPLASPTTSQLFSQANAPLQPRPSSATHRAPLPMVVKLPTKISVLPSPVRSLQGPTPPPPPPPPPPDHRDKPVAMSRSKKVVSPFALLLTKPACNEGPDDVSRKEGEEPNSGEAEVVKMDPILTSTPKAKRTLFPEADGADSSPATVAEIAPMERPLSVEPDSAPEELGAENGPSKVLDSPITVSTTADHGVSPPAVEQPQEREKKQQPPLLQRSKMSRQLSSQDGSDSETFSSTGSDLSLDNEGRDTFDPEMQRRLLPMRTTPGPITGRSLLPPLTSVPRGLATSHPPPLSILPPIVRAGPGGELTPSQHLPFAVVPPYLNLSGGGLPSYQEASISPRGAALRGSHAMPPSYAEGRGMNEAQQGRGGGLRAGMQELSEHPIHTAAMEGVSSSQMKTLALQYGVDYRDVGGRTALMYTIMGNQPKMCELLLKLKASVNAKDLAGLTPLLWATYRAKSDVIRVLLKNGGDVSQADQDGRTAFHWAMKTPNIHCLKWLCKYANVTEVVNQPDNDGLTPLHWAVMSDQASHIKMLLSQTKADVSAQDPEGRAPLNYAVLNFSPSCIRAILDHNEGAVCLIDTKGRTALHYACAEGSADCVRTLLSYHKCDIHCADYNGTTPLHWAAAANQAGLLQLLLRRGADRGQQDINDNTALHYAEQRGHTDCVRILKSYGLQRHGSAMSLASRVSVSMAADPPALDEQGHVIFRMFSRQFSLSRESSTAAAAASSSSMNRLPADGQAQSESPVGDQEEVRVQEARGDVLEQHDGGEVTRTEQRSSDQSEEQAHEVGERVQRGSRRRWREALFCGCFARRSNTIVPL